MPHRKTLRQRLLLLGTWPCIVTTLALTIWFTTQHLNLLDKTFSEHGKSIATQVSALSDLSLYAGDTATLQTIANGTVTSGLAYRVEISNNAGIFVSAGKDPSSRASDELSDVPINLVRWVSLSDYSAASAKPWGINAQEPIGTVRVYRDSMVLRSERRKTIFWGLVPGLACLLLAALAARHATRIVIQPLRRIHQTLANLEHRQLAARSLPLNQSAPYELLMLANSVDSLADTLERQKSQDEARLSQALQQATDSVAQAEKSNRARARFMASASHDLRQPLHAMGLFIDSLQADSIAPQRVALQRLQESTEIMGRLLNDLLDISRLDARVLSPDIKAVALEPLFQQLYAIHGPRAELAGTALRWHNANLAVFTDAALLMRILGNMVANAIQHSPRGKILIAARLRIGSSATDSRVLLEVRDSGSGIAPIHHARIFDEFFQVSNTERDARKGFGLGLSICGKIAQVLGTQIELKSALQCGSCFSMLLPAAPLEASQPPVEPQALSNTKLSLRCLIVDDDPAIRDASAALLQQWGCTVDTAADHPSACTLLSVAQAGYDVVLCDLQLGGSVDGLGTLAQARERYPHALLVIISGATTRETLQELRQSGFPLLTKPVAPARLRALLTSHRIAES